MTGDRVRAAPQGTTGRGGPYDSVANHAPGTSANPRTHLDLNTYIRPIASDGATVDDVFPWYPTAADLAGVLTLSDRYRIPSVYHTGPLDGHWQRLARIHRRFDPDSGTHRWTCSHLTGIRQSELDEDTLELPAGATNVRRCGACIDRLETLIDHGSNWHLLGACCRHQHSLAYLNALDQRHAGDSHAASGGPDARERANARQLAERRVAWTGHILAAELVDDDGSDPALAAYSRQLLDTTPPVGHTPVPLQALAPLADIDHPLSYLTWTETIIDGGDRTQAASACRWATTWDDPLGSGALIPPTPASTAPNAFTTDGGNLLEYVALSRAEPFLLGDDPVVTDLGWLLTGHTPDCGQDTHKLYFFTCPGPLAAGLRQATLWRTDAKIHPFAAPVTEAHPADAICSIAQRLQHTAGPDGYMRSAHDAIVAAETLAGSSPETIDTAVELARTWRRPGKALAEAALAICLPEPLN